MKTVSIEIVKYPIYKYSLRWIQDGKHDPKYPKWHEGLPSGRVFNGTSHRVMEKSELTKDELKSKAEEWADRVLNVDKHKSKNPELFELKYSLYLTESWNLTWFCHETFDVGQTDEEALASFEDFVTRMEIENESHGYGYDQFKEGYCLMGAEDRWRWRGIDDNENETKAPCRCSGCKKSGMIRIMH